MKSCKLEQKTPECHTLFVRNRDLGVVCNLLPPVFQKRETAYYVVACTGPSFHIYDVEKLDLLFIGPHYDTLYRPSSGESASICAIAAVGDLTIVAILPFGVLSFCERAKETFSMKIDGFSPSNPIVQLDNIGEYVFALFENGQIFQIDTSNRGIALNCFMIGRRNCKFHQASFGKRC